MVTKKLRKTQKYASKPLLLVCAVIILACVSLAGLRLTRNQHDTHKTPEPMAPSGPTATQQKEQSAVTSQQKKQAVETPPTTTTPTADSVGTTPISLTAKQETNGTVTVFTNLGNISDGNCTLTATNGPKTNTQTAQVIYQPQYSTCAGFSVPISSLGSGTWNLSVNVTSSGGTTTKSISTEVQ